jgi:hypothetical protein
LDLIFKILLKHDLMFLKTKFRTKLLVLVLIMCRIGTKKKVNRDVFEKNYKNQGLIINFILC